MIESGPRPRLELLECGRGLAAFAVVLFHANASSRIEGWRSYDWFTVFQYGVDFFFVLSGFIIYFAHSRDFGHPERLGSYAKKRAIRLLPTLWLVTTATYLLQLAFGMPADLDQFLRSAFPYPSLRPTDPAVVWT
ncbi:MAG: acyltransferase family protein, partial [Gammaproteobacteria bacterium]